MPWAFLAFHRTWQQATHSDVIQNAKYKCIRDKTIPKITQEINRAPRAPEGITTDIAEKLMEERGYHLPQNNL